MGNVTSALYSRENDCRNCYKCIRNCPVKSISFSKGQASIILKECILCGTCYNVCPQECKVVRDDKQKALGLLSTGKAVCSLAPSFLSAFPGVPFNKMEEALLDLGFAKVEETALGATIVKREYENLLSKNRPDVMISTCCHAVNLLVQKHYPELSHCLAPVLSPMLAHGKIIKENEPTSPVIFIGPCIAKKNEADMYPSYIDCVLTFKELKDLFKEKGIVPAQAVLKAKEESKCRLFPLEGGILKTMDRAEKGYDYLAVSGMDEVKEALNSIKRGEIHHAFIEMSSCRLSCINGPVRGEREEEGSALLTRLSIKKTAGRRDFPISTSDPLKQVFYSYGDERKVHTEEEIEEVLHSIGKFKKEDELNCSSCGYATCREKAIAVLDGKANLEMCLPFLMESQKSVSGAVVTMSDNPILVLDEGFQIQLINPSMQRLLGPEAKMGDLAGAYMDLTLFADALEAGRAVSQIELPNGRILRAHITRDERFHLLIGVFRDITESTRRKAEEKVQAEKTAEITRSVIERNMRTVQEIASLLGESAADTKLALKELEDALLKKQQ